MPRPFAGGGRVWGHSRLFWDIALECKRPNQIATEAESDIPIHVRVHVHEGRISRRGLRYQGVVRVWLQDGGN